LKELGDKLTAVSMLYGSSVNMESAQSQYMRAYQELFAKVFEGNHETPAVLSEDGEKAKKEWENRDVKPVKYFKL